MSESCGCCLICWLLKDVRIRERHTFARDVLTLLMAASKKCRLTSNTDARFEFSESDSVSCYGTTVWTRDAGKERSNIWSLERFTDCALLLV